MPDWSYQPIFKPILSLFPAKRARQLLLSSVQTVHNLPGGRTLIEMFGAMKPSSSLHRVVGGVEFPSAVGMSGLIDPNLSATSALSNFGFGFVMIGPVRRSSETSIQVTLDPNTKTITYHPDIECVEPEVVAQKLQRYKNVNIPRVIHVSGDDPEEAIRKTSSLAEAFVFEGSIEAYQAAKRMVQVPIFYHLKYGSYTLLDALRDLATVDGVFIDDKTVDESGTVYSGEAKRRVLTWIEQIKLTLPDIPLIACAGIYEPQDALDVLHNGADLVVVHSGLIFSGPGLPKRINEAMLDEQNRRKEGSNHSLGWMAWFLMGLGVMFAGVIALILGFGDVIVSYDENFLGISRSAIIHWNITLFHFMSHDRVTLAGVMISAGWLYSLLAYNAVRRASRWAVRVFQVAGVLGFANFFYFVFVGYLDYLHLIYNLLILPLFIAGWILIPSSPKAHVSRNRRNTSKWFYGLIGQLIFVLLGFGVIVAGVAISTIGMTYVYIRSDIQFLGVTPAAIYAFNHHMTPLIAHDRAGLGGALISEGLILLLTTLWGYREGERWLWWGYSLGGIAALAPAITVHFVIGYTTFRHLLPAYVACLAVVAGLVFSYRYLCSR